MHARLHTRMLNTHAHTHTHTFTHACMHAHTHQPEDTVVTISLQFRRCEDEKWWTLWWRLISAGVQCFGHGWSEWSRYCQHQCRWVCATNEILLASMLVSVLLQTWKYMQWKFYRTNHSWWYWSFSGIRVYIYPLWWSGVVGGVGGGGGGWIILESPYPTVCVSICPCFVRTIPDEPLKLLQPNLFPLWCDCTLSLRHTYRGCFHYDATALLVLGTLTGAVSTMMRLHS